MKRILLSVAALAAMSGAHAQTITEVVLPQFIQGVSPTNNDRSPLAFALTISGLTPSATYRYFNQVVIDADAPTVSGAGNVIFANLSTDFSRSTGPGINSAGNYGEFTTDASGAVTRWFITEPTGNATRFVPGTQIAMNIMLNDGAGGTTVASRTRTTSKVTVRNFGATGSDLSGLYPDNNYSGFAAKNIVIAYDNTAGTGRPLAASMIESDGLALPAANYADYYDLNVDGQTGRFGLAVPNGTPVRRIEVRSLSNPNTIVHVVTNATGVWGSVNTGALTSGAAGTAFAPVAAASVSDWALFE